MDLVTIQRFSTPHEAFLAKSRLESEGIPAFVQDANIVQMNWLYSNLVGGVRLQVAFGDATQAIEILGSTTASELGDERLVDICSECGGSRIEVWSPARRATFLTWLLLGLPLWRSRPGWACQDCGHKWR